MTRHCGVFRSDDSLAEARDRIAELIARAGRLRVEDKGRAFNTDLVEALELGSLLSLAQATLASARARTESRGAHWREDFPQRDDEDWLRHTLITASPDGPVLNYKPVTITRFEPKPRKY